MKKRMFLSLTMIAISMFFILVLSSCDFDINDLLTIGQVKEVTPEQAKIIDSDSNNKNSIDNSSTYTVKFTDGSSEITSLRQSVSKNGKVTKPSKYSLPSKQTQRFSYWSLNGNPYDFDSTVTRDLTLNAEYEYISEYDTYANSSNTIFHTDFYDEDINNFSYPIYDIGYSTFQKTNSANKIGSSCKFDLTNGLLAINFGNNRITNPGIVNIYFEVSTFKLNTNDYFFNIIGSNKYTNNSEVFSLVNSSTGLFGFQSETSYNYSKYSIGTYNNIRVKIDMPMNNITVYYNGNELFTGIYSSITEINGICFKVSQNNSSMLIDNIAVTYEKNSSSSLENVKSNARNTINNYWSSYEYQYTLNDSFRNYIDNILYSLIDSINYAYSEQEVNSLLNQFYSIQSAQKYSVIVYPCTEAYYISYNIDCAYINYISGYTSSHDVDMQISNLYFNGYIIEGVYSNSALTEYANYNSVKNGKTLYAKLRVTIDSYWYVDEEMPGQGSTVSGRQLNSICYVFGNVTAKDNSGQTRCIGFELARNGGGYLEIDVPSNKNVSVTLEVCSNGSANATDNVYLIDTNSIVINPIYFYSSSSNSFNDYGIMSIYGTQNTTIEYHLGEGVYFFQTGCTTRGIRLKAVGVYEY